jgi:AcrR family transcriptional regulator
MRCQGRPTRKNAGVPTEGGRAPRDRSRRRRREGSGEASQSGPTQIIEAAIASILEIGFYRSSTNEIAQRANVSGGALQYHFGTREGLLFAVVHELNQRFVAKLEAAQITGETLEDRLASLYRVLGRHYDDPLYLVFVQVLLNLQHDPDTSAEVTAELSAHVVEVERAVRRLLSEALGREPDAATIVSLHHTIRGYALSRQLSRAVPVKGARPGGPTSLHAFLRGLAASTQAP